MSRRQSLPSVPVNEQRRRAQDRGSRIRDATRDPSGVPEVFKEFRLNDHRRHRGRQYLDYMVGATREKHSRPVSHRDFTGARYMRRATSSITTTIRDSFPSEAEEKTSAKSDALPRRHKNNNKGRNMIYNWRQSCFLDLVIITLNAAK